MRAALQATLRNHPAVAGKEAEVEAKRYVEQGARSQRYPSFTAQAQQYADQNRSTLSGNDLSRPAVLRLRQPIWAFGRIHNNIAEAKAEVSTERADLLRVSRQLVEQAAVAYAQVRGRRQQIDVARQNVTRHEALLAQIQRRVKGQLASTADERLAATRLAQARALLERAISDWRGARDDLAALTQVSVGANEPVPPALLALPDSPDLIEKAVDQSADVDYKQQQLSRPRPRWTRPERPACRRSICRRTSSTISRGCATTASSAWCSKRHWTGSASRRGDAPEKPSPVAWRRSRISPPPAWSSAGSSRTLQRSRRLQSKLIDLQSQSLDDLKALLASYQRQYESGAKSWLDLMNVQRELYEQEHELVQVESDWQVYSLELLARIGAPRSPGGHRRKRRWLSNPNPGRTVPTWRWCCGCWRHWTSTATRRVCATPANASPVGRRRARLPSGCARCWSRRR